MKFGSKEFLRFKDVAVHALKNLGEASKENVAAN
jgi:hypothetical protein